MMRWIQLALAAFPAFALVGDDGFALVRDGHCTARVVAASGPERDAAEFFANEAAKCVGARFDVVSAVPADGNRVVFQVKSVPWKDEDAYSIDFPDERTMRISCSPVSARWALNRLLRDFFGVRWLFAKPERFGEGELNEYPQARDVVVPRREIRRGPYSFWSLRHVDWTLDSWREHWDEKGFRRVHYMFADVFPVYKYGVDQSWPEAMLPTHEGRKFLYPKADSPLPADPGKARKKYKKCRNPCFSNPGSAEVAIANVLESLEKDPSKKLVSIDVNDIGGCCQCEACLRSCGGRVNSIGKQHHSDAYYAWANRIAEAVTAKHPDVYFAAIAYREVMDPPGFRLHPHVLVRICFEISAMADPEVRARRLKMMDGWKACAENVELYDYAYGINWYCFPRVHFRLQSEMMRRLHDEYGASGYYTESRVMSPFEGPKHYLLGEVLADCSVDPGRVVREWCECAVGEKAAAPLLEYFRFWEDYNCGEEIRSTEWFSHSKFNIYLPGGRVSSMFALRRGDMAKCRALLERTLALADTPMRRKRASLFLEFFELTELSAKAVFAEELPADGKVASAADAVPILRRVPEAVAACAALKRHPKAKYLGHLPSMDSELRGCLARLATHSGDESVRAEMARLAADGSLPPLVRGMCRIWSGARAENLVPNGSFEAPSPMPTGWFKGNVVGRRVDDNASDGRFSLAARDLMAGFSFVPKPGGTYLVMFDACANKSSSEGKMNLRISRMNGVRAVANTGYYGLSVPQGQWQTYSGVVTAASRDGVPDAGITFHIYGKNYEPDEKVWIDNVRVYCVD